MTAKKSPPVQQAEINAYQGSITAMEFLSRRLFEGRGVAQCHLWSFVWSSIAMERGVKHLESLNQFSFKKMSLQDQNQAHGIVKETLSTIAPYQTASVA